MRTLFCQNAKSISEETLNRGPDSLWLLKIQNLPIGLCPSLWPPKHPPEVVSNELHLLALL